MLSAATGIASADLWCLDFEFPSFGESQLYDVGTSPKAVIKGDVNGDGLLDVITTNEGSGTIEVMLGLANGTLGQPRPYPCGPMPRTPSLIYLRGDTFVDLAVPNFVDEGTVTLLLNDGTGVFSILSTLSVNGQKPRTVAAADLDGDNIDDIVTANTGSLSISILWGRFNSSFSEPETTIVGAAPGSVTIADMNLDGLPDLVLTNRVSDTVCVLFNLGERQFDEPNCYPTALSPRHEVVADFNGDGWPDIATCCLNSGVVTVHSNFGNGLFLGFESYPCGPTPHALAPADFDFDGDQDLVIANSGEQTVVLINNGQGVFLERLDIPVMGFLFVLTMDYNLDGSPDIVGAQTGPNHTAAIPNTTFPPCYGDVDGDYAVGFSDLTMLLGNFGANPAPAGDTNCDGAVDFADLNMVLGRFGVECHHRRIPASELSTDDQKIFIGAPNP